MGKQKGIREYLVSECVLFRKTKEEYGGLSNMAPGYSIKINDVIIPSSEHLYQACRFPDYPEIQWEIINEKSPMKAKWIGRKHIEQSRKDWDKVRFMVMRWAIEVKLSQNWNKFSALLLSTGDRPIVELTPKDKIWGATRNGDYCGGVNALGRLLMHVREEYAKKNLPFRCVPPIDIENFYFLDFQIGEVCNDKEEYGNNTLDEEYLTQEPNGFNFKY
ncbi:MAG: NADAR family protein [Bacteroidota bacterium]|nr:NADAR family protein [Bacteroidota bacterium]